jgi:hypothetical protein
MGYALAQCPISPGRRGFSKRTAAGQVISAQHDVASTPCDRVKVGDTISVRYLAADPSVHMLGSRARLETLKLWMAGGWLLLAGIYLLFGK